MQKSERETPYFIGQPGVPWGETEKAAWLAVQKIQRSYQANVVSEIDKLAGRFDVEQYNTLEYSNLTGENYPLFAVKSRHWVVNRPIVLITGGVHGYETSGVHGALRFIQEHLEIGR